MRAPNPLRVAAQPINIDKVARATTSKALQLLEISREKRISQALLPVNPVLNKGFSGHNQFMLFAKMLEVGSNDPRFLTLNDISNQATDCQVLPGEEPLFLIRPVTQGEKVYFKPYPIFHATQIDNLSPHSAVSSQATDTHEWLVNLVKESGAESEVQESMNQSSQSDAMQLRDWYLWAANQAFNDQSANKLEADLFSLMAGRTLGLPVVIESSSDEIHTLQSSCDSHSVDEQAKTVKTLLSAINRADQILGIVLNFKSGLTPNVEWWNQSSQEDSLSMGMG